MLVRGRPLVRFLLRQNVARYRHLLRDSEDPQRRGTLEKLLTDAEQELAELDSRSASSGQPPALAQWTMTVAEPVTGR